jgi:hypothetical protein
MIQSSQEVKSLSIAQIEQWTLNQEHDNNQSVPYEVYMV